MEKGECHNIVLTSSISPGGNHTFDSINFAQNGANNGGESLIDQYDYIMHGKVFKFQLGKGD